MVVRSSLGAGWRERERERLELSVNQHHDPATNDANLLIDGSSCTYYYTLVITMTQYLVHERVMTLLGRESLRANCGNFVLQQKSLFYCLGIGKYLEWERLWWGLILTT
jgi:hypothetical protein